jgi:hypothetical protein
MSDCTVRADARTLPESTDPAPSDEYAKLWAAKCVADARYEVAAEKRKAEKDKVAAAKAEEPKLEASRAFAQAFHAWLAARAGIEDPSLLEGEEQDERFRGPIPTPSGAFSQRRQPTRINSGKSWRRSKFSSAMK